MPIFCTCIGDHQVENVVSLFDLDKFSWFSPHIKLMISFDHAVGA